MLRLVDKRLGAQSDRLAKPSNITDDTVTSDRLTLDGTKRFAREQADE